jgi:hypothetical protein
VKQERNSKKNAQKRHESAKWKRDEFGQQCKHEWKKIALPSLAGAACTDCWLDELFTATMLAPFAIWTGDTVVESDRFPNIVAACRSTRPGIDVANTAAEPEADISGNGEDDPSLSRPTTSSRMLLFIKLSAPATAATRRYRSERCMQRRLENGLGSFKTSLSTLQK